MHHLLHAPRLECSLAHSSLPRLWISCCLSLSKDLEGAEQAFRTATGCVPGQWIHGFKLKQLHILPTKFGQASKESVLCASLGEIPLNQEVNRMGSVVQEEVSVHADSGLHVYKLERGQLSLRVTNWGATVLSLFAPNAEGKVEDIVLGFDNLDPYLDGTSPYFGSVVGRVANRIANATFTLDGVEYFLPSNDGPNTLHGGVKGFDKVLWRVEEARHPQGPSVRFTYHSHDGEEGFPGDLDVAVTYTLISDTELQTEMEARPRDKATPVNLAQHAYWNLGGHNSGDVLQHSIQIRADHITPVCSKLIPTGEIVAVSGTPFDFTQEAEIGSRMGQVGGYDHNYVLRRDDAASEEELHLAARVRHPTSGRALELFTNAPGMQFYTGNLLAVAGKGGAFYSKHTGFCLETQGFPNAVNQAGFPSVIVKPGETYRHVMVHRFTIS